MSVLSAVSKGHRVGMDLAAPWGVYLNGGLLAEHATEQDGDALYLQLVDGLRKLPPVELTSRFLLAEQVSFELVRHSRTVRLWISTVTRRPGAPEITKFHVTDYDATNCIFMTDFESASAFFESVSAAKARE